jgi:hypothetical protein
MQLSDQIHARDVKKQIDLTECCLRLAREASHFGFIADITANSFRLHAQVKQTVHDLFSRLHPHIGDYDSRHGSVFDWACIRQGECQAAPNAATTARDHSNAVFYIDH